MVKSGKIINIEVVKEGVSRGRKWSLYRLTFDDKFTCTTFDGFYEVGQEVNLTVEKNPRKGANGVTYENWQVVPAKPKRESVVAQNGKFEEIMGVLAGINEKLDQVLDDLNKRP